MNNLKSFTIIIFIVAGLSFFQSNGQQLWDGTTYPDEDGFQQRIAPMLERIAEQDFGKLSLANSRCPDTGLPVKGETIISPYRGRA